MSEKPLFLFGCQPGRRVHIKEFITCRDPLEIKEDIYGFYRILSPHKKSNLGLLPLIVSIGCSIKNA